MAQGTILSLNGPTAPPEPTPVDATFTAIPDGPTGEAHSGTVTFTGTPYDGDWQLAIGETLSPTVAYDATASEVETALTEFLNGVTVADAIGGGFALTDSGVDLADATAVSEFTAPDATFTAAIDGETGEAYGGALTFTGTPIDGAWVLVIGESESDPVPYDATAEEAETILADFLTAVSVADGEGGGFDLTGSEVDLATATTQSTFTAPTAAFVATPDGPTGEAHSGTVTIDGTPDGGAWVLVAGEGESEPVPYDATAGEAETILAAYLGAVNVTAAEGGFSLADSLSDLAAATVISTLTDSTPADPPPAAVPVAVGGESTETCVVVAVPSDAATVTLGDEDVTPETGFPVEPGVTLTFYLAPNERVFAVAAQDTQLNVLVTSKGSIFR